ISSGVANITTPYTFANPYDRRTPFTIQYLLNVQRELPKNSVLEAGYLGSISRHLESLRAVNEALPACPSRNARPGCENDPLAGLTIPQRSPVLNFGRFQYVDFGGIRTYYTLVTQHDKRLSLDY